MIATDTSLRHRGLYVEGRYFEDQYEQARSFAFALACEYMRPIAVVYNTPSERPRCKIMDELTPAMAA